MSSTSSIVNSSFSTQESGYLTYKQISTFSKNVTKAFQRTWTNLSDFATHHKASLSTAALGLGTLISPFLSLKDEIPPHIDNVNFSFLLDKNVTLVANQLPVAIPVITLNVLLLSAAFSSTNSSVKKFSTLTILSVALTISAALVINS